MSFFVVVYHERGRVCELRAGDMDGRKLTWETGILNLLARLEEHSVEGAFWDAEVSRRAAKAVRILATRRQLL